MPASIDQSAAQELTSPRTPDIIELSESEEDNYKMPPVTKLRTRCCEPEHFGVIDLTLSQSDSDREDTSQLQSADRHPRLGAKPSKKGQALESEKGETGKLTDTQSIKRNQPIPFDAETYDLPLKTPVTIEPLYVDSDESEPGNRMGNDDEVILVDLDEPKLARKPIVISSIPSEALDYKSSGDAAIPKQGLPKRKSRKADSALERERYAEELFSELNEAVFKCGLPKETKLTWNKRLLTTAGRANWRKNKEGHHYTEIELSEKILDCKERIRNTLSHEMCHLATWVIDADPKQAHGRLWKRWASKVMKKRPEIEISTRHNYEISYPYQWKCQKCAKIYGRFSKSIRPDECVCGACKEGRLVPLFTVRQRSQGTSTGDGTKAVESRVPRSTTVTPNGVDGVIDSESEVELLLTALKNATL